MTALATRRSGAVSGVAAPALASFAAALSLSASIAHFGVAKPHFEDWWVHGAAFIAMGALQALLAALLVLRPRATSIALAGVAGNLAIVTMYVYSRTNGTPVGPHAGVPEPARWFDLTTTGIELVLVGTLIAMLGEDARRWGMRLVLLAGVGLWTGRIAGVM